jgi:hypothetical protein
MGAAQSTMPGMGSFGGLSRELNADVSAAPFPVSLRL